MKRLPITMTQHQRFETMEYRIIKFRWRMERREALSREHSLDVVGKEILVGWRIREHMAILSVV